MSESVLDILVGPVTPLGNSAYDRIHLAQMQRARDEWPLLSPIDPPCDIVANTNVAGSSYYDSALSGYLIYARTGDESFRTVARDVAKHTSDSYMNSQNIVKFLSGDYSVQCSNPINWSSTGSGIHYLDTGYQPSRDAVKAHASFAAYQCCANFIDDSVGTRVAAYYLMALVEALMLGDRVGYPTGLEPGGADLERGARDMLESILAGQQTTGQLRGGWADTVSPNGGNNMTPGTVFCQNFMQGLQHESLILYDRVVGDSRIVPALKANADYLWTQWRDKAGGPCTATAHTTGPWGYDVDQTAPGVGNTAYTGFTDDRTHEGAVSINSCEDYLALLGLQFSVFGYLYWKTGETLYKERGDAMVSGFTQSDRQGAVYPDVKQQNQAFRNSPKYFGYLAQAACPPPLRRRFRGPLPRMTPTPPEAP